MGLEPIIEEVDYLKISDHNWLFYFFALQILVVSLNYMV